MKRAMRWICVTVLLIVIAFVGVSWIYADRLTRARPSEVGTPPIDFPYPIETVRFLTADGQTLSGWLAPAEKSKGAVILLHGFGGNRKQMLPRARFLRELGYTTLLYDARASGESTGDAITFGYRERADVFAAVHFLNARSYNDVACLGVSQGGATILFAAEDLTDVKCVICESVYDEMTHAVDRRMRRYTGTPGWLSGSLLVPFAEHRLDLSINDVRPVDHIAKLSCPVFIVSGAKDDRTWPEDTDRLFQAAREPKERWMIADAKHQDLFQFPGYKDKVQEFLAKHLK